MGTLETQIAFEALPYWVFKTNKGFEVRKDREHGGAEYHGTAKTLEQAKRYIERMQNYESSKRPASN